jgi:hypothetical protein
VIMPQKNVIWLVIQLTDNRNSHCWLSLAH